MPYIQFELDAMEDAPSIAAAAGISEANAGWGLPKLWRRCWREKLDTVTAGVLAGLFGGEGERVAAALVEFGYLEPLRDGVYRVRGAKRYLRISAVRSEAGKKGGKKTAKAGSGLNNLRQNKPNTEAIASAAPEAGTRDALNAEHRSKIQQNEPITEANSEAIASDAPKQEPSNTEALTANSEQRTAKEEASAGDKRPPRSRAPGDPRLKPLTDALVADYEAIRGEKYAHGGAKDTEALKRLLKVAPPEQIRAKWGPALQASGWASASTFAQLWSKWNDLAAPTGPAKGAAWTHAPQPDDPARPYFGAHPGESPEHAAWRAAIERQEDPGPEPQEAA